MGVYYSGAIGWGFVVDQARLPDSEDGPYQALEEFVVEYPNLDYISGGSAYESDGDKFAIVADSTVRGGGDFQDGPFDIFELGDIRPSSDEQVELENAYALLGFGGSPIGPLAAFRVF